MNQLRSVGLMIRWWVSVLLRWGAISLICQRIILEQQPANVGGGGLFIGADP